MSVKINFPKSLEGQLFKKVRKVFQTVGRYLRSLAGESEPKQKLMEVKG
jgi:hypothetical protein